MFDLDGGVEVTRTIEDEGYVNEAGMVVRYLNSNDNCCRMVIEGSSQVS